MDQLPDKKTIINAILFSSVIILILILTNYFHRQTTIVFCDVGQGDAIYLRIQNKIDILIDTGPNAAVLTCLGKYMPFYDRNLEYVIITHSQRDHFGGFLEIAKRYKITLVILPQVIINTKNDKLLKLILNKNKIPAIYLYQQISIGLNNRLYIIPTNKYSKSCDKANTCPLVSFYKFNDFTALFTSDISSSILKRLPRQYVHNLMLLQIPHHGSKHGLKKDFFQLADPLVSVISVGKNNSYGHPSQEVIEILEASNTIIRRTDKEGDIMFKTNY